MGDAWEEGGGRSRSWYLSREEIERDSPSRQDGVGAAKEAELRATYCSFIRDVCVRLQLPQITMATAILLCHRFYLRQSHAKNEWQTLTLPDYVPLLGLVEGSVCHKKITQVCGSTDAFKVAPGEICLHTVATVCVFLASKIEDTPCLLKSVAIVAYETMYRKNNDAAKRIYQEEILAKQKSLILVGETLLLSTIRFDFNILHPYEPLKLALNNLGISQKEVRQVAMSLINDTLPTTLVVQFKPHFIAAGSLFLAAKFHNVILPSQSGRVWWNEFDVEPKQLQAVIQQMTELFKKRYPCSMGPVIMPTPTPTPTDKQQIKPSPTLTSTNKQQIKQTPTPTPTNKQQIKQTPTLTPTVKQQIKPPPIPTRMGKQHINLPPFPTTMDKQKIKAIAAPTPTDKHQIISTPDPAPRHTESSRRSFSNSNTEAYGYVPLGSSFDDKSTGRSARYEEKQYWRKYEENLYQRKHINYNLDQRLAEQSYRGILKVGRVNEAAIRSFDKKSTSRSARRTHEENPYQRTHIHHDFHAVDMDQRLQEHSCWETLKPGCVNEAGIRDLKKRRIQEVARLQAPVYTTGANAWRFERLVSYVETNSSWKKQKVERR